MPREPYRPLKRKEGAEPYRVPEIPMSGTFNLPLKRLLDNGPALALSGLAALVMMGGVLRVLEGRSGSAAALTPQARSRLPLRDFAVPQERKYPINDRRHGQLALTYVAAPSNLKYRYQVMSRVFPRYPSLINWWLTTKPGRQDGLSVSMFRRKIKEYRKRMQRQSGVKRQQTENEIAALQFLVGMAPRLKQLAGRQAPARRTA